MVVVVGGGMMGAEEQERFTSQGRGKCVDGQKEQKWSKINVLSGRNVSDSPDKMNLRSAPPD